MARHLEYIIMGPSPDIEAELPSRPRKSLSVRRDSKHVTNLRTLYRNSDSQPQLEQLDLSKESSTATPTTLHLPPTPPTVEGHAENGESERDVVTENPKAPSLTATPVNQQSPPTPENTPPRRELRVPKKPFLTLQPSLASTRAESFRTAREDVYSDTESELSLPQPGTLLSKKMSPPPQVINNPSHGPAPFHELQTPQTPGGSSQIGEILPSSGTLTHPLPEVFQYMVTATPPPVYANTVPKGTAPNHEFDMSIEHVDEGAGQSGGVAAKSEEFSTTKSPRTLVRRDRSLRERLEEAKRVSPTPSTDKFASIIGWTNTVNTNEEGGNKRWSGVSTTSTIEAYVVDSPSKLQRKRGTLRHVGKNPSLRSASSPIPDSNRSSFQSTSDSPHRLVHKKAKLTNQNRWSDGSDFSRSFSVGSGSAFTKPEIITVAVIPERSSSLQSSANSSRRHSTSNSAASTSKHTRKSSAPQSTITNRKRTISEATDRSRDRKYPPQVPPQVPPRNSSRSAPTSRTTSRANSITSEHFTTVQRKQAEKDLRQTLDRMESERLVSSSSNTPGKQSLEIEGPPPATEPVLEPIVHTRRISIAAKSNTPDRSQPATRKTSADHPEWTNLRPPTMLGTPFSAPSFMTGSPEIVEATAVNLFPHNNRSVQLIEPNLLTESQAVRELRQQHAAQFQGLPALDVNNAQVSPKINDTSYTDSPLRNPRMAPQPPRNAPSALAVVNNDNGQVVSRANTTPTKRPGTLRKRPVMDDRTRSDSFAKSLIRNFSTRQAKNPKAGQEINSSSHPLWRPGAFWDDQNANKAEEVANNQNQNTERSLTVSNSLGLPQQRSIIIGPGALLRKLSNTARGYYGSPRSHDLHKQASLNSLDRFRATRQLYKSPTTNLTMHFTRLRGMQDKLLRTMSRREEERAEKRRDMIRKSIGPNVTPKSDSRFPVSMT